jgi:hypothetical protein
MTSLPEWTPNKTTVPSIVAPLSNGCKQEPPLLTTYPQRARHNMYVAAQELLNKLKGSTSSMSGNLKFKSCYVREETYF